MDGDPRGSDSSPYGQGIRVKVGRPDDSVGVSGQRPRANPITGGDRQHRPTSQRQLLVLRSLGRAGGGDGADEVAVGAHPVTDCHAGESTAVQCPSAEDARWRLRLDGDVGVRPHPAHAAATAEDTHRRPQRLERSGSVRRTAVEGRMVDDRLHPVGDLDLSREHGGDGAQGRHPRMLLELVVVEAIEDGTRRRGAARVVEFHDDAAEQACGPVRVSGREGMVDR